MADAFKAMGRTLDNARRDFAAPNINGVGAYEGGQLPGALVQAALMRTARAAIDGVKPELMAEFLADTLAAKFGKVKASLILRDALAGVEK